MNNVKKKTSKSVTVKLSNDVIVNQELSAWGMATEVNRDNIIPPAIRLCQSMSERVQEGLNKPGDMIDTLSGEILGNYDSSIEIIPFLVNSSWKIFVDNKFQSQEPMTKANQNAALNETRADGTVLRRDKCLDVWVVLPHQIEAGNAIPFVITFSRTGYNAGKKIETRIFRNRIHNPPLSPAAYTMSLHALKKENEKGRFACFDVNDVRLSSEEEQLLALRFFKELDSKKDNIQMPAEEEETSQDATLF